MLTRKHSRRNATMAMRLNRLSHRNINPILLSAVMLCGCVHALAIPESIPAKDTAMTTPAAVPTPRENPTLTAEEIGQRFLKLIEGLKSRDDLSLERIRDVTGITLTHEPGALGAGYWSHDLGGGWRYALTYYPESPSLLQGVGLLFQHGEDRFADMTQICGLDFEHYHSALKAMGYRGVPIYGEIGQLEFWRYYKDNITLSILPQNVVPGQDGRLCIKSISTLN